MDPELIAYLEARHSQTERHFDIQAERMSSDVRQLAEVVSALAEKVESVKQELREELGSRIDIVTSAVTSVAKRVDSVSERVDSVATGLASVSERVDSVATGLALVSERVDSVATGLDSVSERVDSVSERLDSVATRLDSVEHNLREEILRSQRELSAMIKFSYAELERRIETVEGRFGDLEDRVRRLESQR